MRGILGMETGSGESVSHTFTQSGTYTVTLTVTNGLGGFATHTIDITVDGEPVPGRLSLMQVLYRPLLGMIRYDFGVTATDPSGSALTFTGTLVMEIQEQAKVCHTRILQRVLIQ